MEKAISGEWFVSQTKYGPFVHARLGIGEENSGKLVAEVRNRAKEIAERESLDFIIIDGPPGIGCPVISSLSGTDLALVVTEPTLAGIHDMERVLHMTRHFHLSSLVCINKADIYPAGARHISEYCDQNQVEIAGSIPFDETVTRAMVIGEPVTAYQIASPASQALVDLWQRVLTCLEAASRAYDGG